MSERHAVQNVPPEQCKMCPRNSCNAASSDRSGSAALAKDPQLTSMTPQGRLRPVSVEQQREGRCSRPTIEATRMSQRRCVKAQQTVQILTKPCHTAGRACACGLAS